MAVALIVAAGRGERLGADRPKALVPLAGRPMLRWSVDALRAVPDIGQIVVAMPAAALADAPPGVTAVAGGSVRSESVLLALRATAPGAPGEAVVVHDAARPLARAELFERALNELEASGADAVLAAAPVPDTIKEVGSDGATVVRTVDRRSLWAVQTPQVFRRQALESVLAAADPQLLAAATDDAWLLERAGGKVRLIDTGAPNLKVTTEADLRVAEALLAER